MSRTRLLVTGFGPFPLVPRNPSALVARALAASPRLRLAGIDTTCVVLTTAYAAIETELLAALRDTSPDAVLMIGVAARRRRVSVEARALNRASRLFPDASGRISPTLSLEPGGPAILRAHAPIAALRDALRRAGLPAEISRDAGRYLCNAASFAALRAGGRDGPPCVFIHIPLPRGAGRRDPRPTVAAMATGLEAVARILARRARRAGHRQDLNPGRDGPASVRP